MFRPARFLVAASSLTLITACSGGGGGGNPPPANNTPPQITSPATASVQENSAGTVYQVVATDADGDALTYTISGGPDSARFRISTTGAVTFVSPPDFEAPTDVGADNVYNLQVAVSDGNDARALNVAITVTNAGPDNFVVNRVATGFNQPVFLAPLPDGTGRVFVVERAGRIALLNPTNGTSTTFLDVTGQTSTTGERGLLGFATAPNYATSGIFYIFLTNLAGDIEVRRYSTFAGQLDLGNPATADLILTVPHPGQDNHYGGWIGFGNDGFLYVATGDGGGAGDPANNAQNTNVLLGKILRVDVATDAFPADPNRDYAIPTGNPFATTGGAPEVWAYGLRNPYRASIDGSTGILWIGDVGQAAREEINAMFPTPGGSNFGWRFLEGTTTFNGTPPSGVTPPVAEYAHGTGEREGNSVTGGYVYRGPVESLNGHYIFGDYVNANIWSFRIAQAALGTTIPAASFTLRKTAFAPTAGTINNISSFGIDQSNNLYIVDFDGEIFRVDPAP
jgi:glucose/arabinose dehydrogenase